MDVEQLVPSITNEPSQVASPGHVPPSPHGWVDVEQTVPSIPKEPSQVASSSHALPIPDDDELNKLSLDLYGHRFYDESLAAHPSLGSPPSGPAAHGWMDLEQPEPSITNEPSQVTSPGHAPPSPGDDVLNKLSLDLYGHRFSDESLAGHPSWGSPPSGPAHGWIGVEQPVPSMSNEPSQVASPGHAQPSPGDDVLSKLLLDLYGHRFYDESLAAHPSWGSPPSGPTAHGWMDLEQPVPSITNEKVTSPGHALPSPGDDVLNKLSLDLYGHRFSDESLAAHPSWGSPPSGPAHGWMDVEQPVPSMSNELSQGASPGHAPPISGDEALNKLWLDLYGHRLYDE
jgi:hypothetical protein